MILLNSEYRQDYNEPRSVASSLYEISSLTLIKGTTDMTQQLKKKNAISVMQEFLTSSAPKN